MRRPRGLRAAAGAGLAGALLALSACSGGAATTPGESDIDVDTPALREQKVQADIETCTPGPGASGSNSLPALTLPCLGGGPDVDLSTLKGPVLINLWASWCGPCREELPVLQEFDQRHGDEVPVLGLNMTDNSPVAALGLLRDSDATYPSVADPGGDLYDQPGLRLPQGLPQFILLDADGKIAAQQAGGVTSVRDVVELVEQGLGTTL